MSPPNESLEPDVNQLNYWLTISQERLVIIVFFAEWAGSVQLVRGYMDRIAGEYPELTIKWVNIETESELTASLGVSQVPTIILIKDREVVDLVAGAVSRRKVMLRIQKHLPKK